MKANGPSTPLGAGGLLLAAAIIIVVSAVVAGVLVLRTPGEERARRVDERRIQDLQSIQKAVELRWTGQRTLPATLAELVQQTMPPPAERDPVSGMPYEYRAVSDREYEVCASFAEASPGLRERQPRDFWSHGAGRGCFRLEARALQP